MPPVLKENDVAPSIDAAAIRPGQDAAAEERAFQRAQPVHAAASKAGRFSHCIEPRDSAARQSRAPGFQDRS